MAVAVTTTTAINFRILSTISIMKPTLKQKRTVDTLLAISFIIVLVTGVMLHLKKHGIIIEPRSILKAIHYYTGFFMTACLAFHATVYYRILRSMAKRHKLFCTVTWILAVTFLATLGTGVVKIASPVKIPHLGLWHYWLGMIMSLCAIIHLYIAFPYLLAKFRTPAVKRS